MLKFAPKPSQPVMPVIVFSATKCTVWVQSARPQIVPAQNRLLLGNILSPQFLYVLCVIWPQQDKNKFK